MKIKEIRELTTEELLNKIEELKLDKYIRYVDDIIIISDNKKQLIDTLPLIQNKLAETHQFINKKTKI